MRDLLSYSSLRMRLRHSLRHHETALHGFRMLRFSLVQGPWRPWMMRRYAAAADNPAMDVLPTTLFEGFDAAAAERDLRLDACAREFNVPFGLVDAIVAWSRETGAKRIDDPHIDCAAVQRIAHDPRIVDVARRFLRTEPILFTSKIYWTVPPADAAGQQLAAAEKGRFHYDLADLSALTVFVYLTDVDEQSGPHVVIRGTQRRVMPWQILRRNISDDYARRRYGERIETITGPRGTGWFEDIACYHKQAMGTKVRLMLSIIYSMHRRPLDDLELRLAAATDSRPADRLRKATA
jgi:hypothetical protein